MDPIFLYLLTGMYLCIGGIMYANYIEKRNMEVYEFILSINEKIHSKCDKLISLREYHRNINYYRAFYDNSINKFYNRLLFFSFKKLTLENYFPKEKIEWLDNDEEYWD